MSSGGNWKEMFLAACAGDIELVRYHVNSGVDINYAHPEFLSTPLVACILAKQEAVADFLIDSGANIHLHSEFDGMSPVQAAHSVNLHELERRLRALGATEPVQASMPEVRRSWWRHFLNR